MLSDVFFLIDVYYDLNDAMRYDYIYNIDDRYLLESHGCLPQA